MVDRGSILAHCTAVGSSANQLWEVPLDGATPTPITALNSGQGTTRASGATSATGTPGSCRAERSCNRPVPAAPGSCPASPRRAHHPGQGSGVSDDVVVTGATADALMLRGQVGCAGTTSLVRFDPRPTPCRCCSDRRSTAGRWAGPCCSRAGIPNPHLLPALLARGICSRKENVIFSEENDGRDTRAHRPHAGDIGGQPGYRAGHRAGRGPPRRQRRAAGQDGAAASEAARHGLHRGGRDRGRRR